MKPLLRPGTTVVRRSATTLQIGTVTGAVRVVADAPAVTCVLRGADGTQDLTALAATTGHPYDVVVTAARMLLDAGVVVDVAHLAEVGGPGPLAGEARALALAHHRETPSEQLARLRARAGAAVEITADLATTGLAGRLARVLRDAGVPVSTAPLDTPSLVVVLSTGPGPREAFDVLTGAGLAHLPVVCEADRARIGPLVRPGASPCVRCDDRDRTSGEPAWPLVLAQHEQPIVAATPVHPHALGALGGYAIALRVAAEVIDFCDGRTAASEGAVAVAGSGLDAAPSYSPVVLQPDCACQILSAGPGRAHHTGVVRGVRMTA